MKLRQRTKGGNWYVDARWKGFPRVQASTGTPIKSQATAIIGTLQRLKHLGRRDILQHIADRTLSLADAHELYWQKENMSAIDERLRARTSRTLGSLTDEWIEWMRSPATVSPKRGQPYSAGTVARYEQSLECLFRALPKGKDSMLEDLTKGFFAAYTAERMKAGRSGATINRDLNTMRSFWSYLEEWTPLQPTRFRFRLAKESRGRERWLDASEIEAARAVCPSKWWLLFSMLIQTGMRIGEAQGLRWSDIRFDENYIELHDQYRRLKTATSQRHVLLPHDLKMLLHAEAVRRPSIGPALVFSDTRGNRQNALRMWQRVVKKAGIEHACLHDLRHTFGVHAARSGIPLARLQKLMGHSSTAMTLRYLAHSPENHLGNDAALLSASIRGERISAAPTLPAVLSLVKDA